MWAHDETRKSFGGAGARVVDAISLSIPISSLDGKDPRESTEVVDALADVLKKLDDIFPGPGGPAPEAYAW